MRVTQPFDASTLLSIDPELRRRVGFTQGHELVEWQMGVFRQPLRISVTFYLLETAMQELGGLFKRLKYYGFLIYVK
jgi:hypothetical protein